MRKTLHPQPDVDTLRKVGLVGTYAYGGYLCVCTDCKEQFCGEKRARQCLPCAVKSLKQALNTKELEGQRIGMEQAAGLLCGHCMTGMPRMYDKTNVRAWHNRQDGDTIKSYPCNAEPISVAIAQLFSDR